jgi:hypothetical protein
MSAMKIHKIVSSGGASSEVLGSPRFKILSTDSSAFRL